MDQITNQNHRSTKPIKKLEDVTGNRRYVLPKEMQNECDPVTFKPSVMVIINARKIFIPVGEPTEIPQDAFSVLKDVGIITEVYQTDEKFDPLYVH